MDLGVTNFSNNENLTVNTDSMGLRIVAADGGWARMVFRSAKPFAFSISPDESAICMAIDAHLSIGVFLNGKLDESTFHEITTTGLAESPSWAHADDWIAFDYDYGDPRGAQAIWKIMSDGSGLVDISVHGQGEWIMPSWNAAATRLVYVRYVMDTPMSEIFAMNADGSNSVRLTHNKVMDVNPHFSPDGNYICYESRAQGVSKIAIIDANGSNHRTIASGAMPTWSPDGRQIAFVAITADPKTNGTVWVVNANGSNAHQVTRSRL